MAKTPKADIKSDVLPMVYNSFESTAPQIQCASIRAAAHVAEYLDENAVRKMVLPRTRSVFETNSGQKVSFQNSFTSQPGLLRRNFSQWDSGKMFARHSAPRGGQ